MTRLLRVPTYEVTSSKHEPISAESHPTATYRLTLGGHWTVPATVFTHTTKDSTGSVLLVADGGRVSQSAEVKRLLDAGHRVIALDPLLWGESKLKAEDPDYVYPLFVSTVGQRPLGIQAAQIAAVARWAAANFSDASAPRIVAVGPRASAAALVATALESEAIADIEMVDGLTSFHELLERNVAVETMPELFAFGLLGEFDVPQLAALAAPRPARFRQADE